MSLKPTIQSIIFDLDGTLLNTISDIGLASNRALEKNGYPTFTIKEYEKKVGHGLRNLVMQTLPEGTNSDVLEKVVNDLLAEYEHCYAKDTFKYPGIDELLDILQDTQIKISVLSNKVDYFTKKIINEIFKNRPFFPVLGSRPEIPKKPDPQGIIEILSALDILPHECIFVGDSGADMKAAKSAGVLPIGVSWGYRSIDHIYESGAHAIIDHPLELVDFLTYKPKNV